MLRGGSVPWRGAQGAGSHSLFPSHPEGWTCCTGNIPCGNSALGVTALSQGALLELASPSAKQSECGTHRLQDRKPKLDQTAAWESLGPSREPSTASVAAMNTEPFIYWRLIRDQHSFQRAEAASEMCCKSEKAALTY